MEQFFDANGICNASKKRSIFFSTIGPNAYQLLASLVALEKPGAKTYAELKEVMEQNLNPPPVEAVFQYRFHSRVRQPRETVAGFVAKLQDIARKCKFGTALSDILRDQLVYGINDEMIQRSLLMEVDLTLEKALKIAQGLEVAEGCTKEL